MKMSGDDLFAALAGRHPERLAHNALCWVLQHDDAEELRKLVLGRSGRVVDVEIERAQATGWRADLVAVAGKRAVKLELKLRSTFTPRQFSALEEGDIDVLVRPDGGKSVEKVRVITWRAIATKCPPQLAELRALFLAAERFGASTIESATGEALWGSFEEFLKGGRRSWPVMYRLLWSLDRVLPEVGNGYRPASGWSQSRRNGYYGFHFSLEGHWCWVGLVRGAERRIVLQASRSDSTWRPDSDMRWPRRRQFKSDESISAAALANWIVEQVKTLG